MRERDFDYGYWMGWFISFGIAATLFTLAVWNGSLVRAAICQPKTDSCFKDLVTTLGGPVTFVGGVVTLFFLWRQVTNAGEYQRQSMQVQLRKSRAFANRAIIKARQGQQLCQSYRRMWRSPLPNWHMIMDLQLGHLKALAENEVFRTVEIEIDILPTMSLEQLQITVDDYTTVHGANTTSYTSAMTDFLKCTERVEEVMSDVEAICMSFIRDTDNMIGTKTIV